MLKIEGLQLHTIYVIIITIDIIQNAYEFKYKLD